MPDKFHTALHRHTDEVLHYLWDPIGISDIPQARDEYTSYVPKVVEKLLNGDDAEAIARHLDTISDESIEFGTNHAKSLRCAEILTDALDYYREVHA